MTTAGGKEKKGTYVRITLKRPDNGGKLIIAKTEKITPAKITARSRYSG